jgi:hypothetical protein
MKRGSSAKSITSDMAQALGENLKGIRNLLTKEGDRM